MKGKTQNYIVQVMEYEECQSSSGNDFITIIARDCTDSTVYKFCCFSDRLTQARRHLKQGARLRIAGGKEYNGSITVVWIEEASKASASLAWKSQIYKDAEDERAFKANRLESLFKDGFVEVIRQDGSKDLLRLRNAMEIAGGGYVSKVDYCMNVLGPQRVEREFKRIFNSTKDLVNSKGDVWDRYYKLLDELLDEALIENSFT